MKILTTLQKFALIFPFAKPFLVKFIYSEKATKFCEISTVDLYYGGDFAKFCGLLSIPI